MQYSIRPIEAQEVPQLESFLYEAIFQPDEENLVPRTVLKQPELRAYIEAFGKKDDHCLVALVDDKIIGAVWTRILAEGVRGFGNLDDTTPEFAISLYKQCRGLGIGTKLMEQMCNHLREKGYAKASLAVQKANYAVKMYRKAGFTVVGENQQEYIMAINLKET